MKTPIKQDPYFECPTCQEKHRIGHLEPSDKTYQWQCECCTDISFIYHNKEELEIVSVKTPPEGKSHLLILLKADFQGTDAKKPVYLIVQKMNYRHELDIKTITEYEEYHYNQHTCPSNYLGGTTILEGDDDDPHGIFKFQEVVFTPEGYDATDFHNQGGNYVDIFPSLKD